MNDRVEIKKKLERRLGRGVPGAVWNNGMVQEVVGEYLNAGSEETEELFDLLLEVVKDRIQLVEEGVSEVLGRELVVSGASRGGHKPERGKLEAESFAGARTEAMLGAMSEFYGGLAAQHPGVGLFRDEVLGGAALAPDEAHGLLASYAARILTLEQFSRWGIPVVGHASELLEYDHGMEKADIDHRATIRVDPPGVTRTSRYAHPKDGEPNTRCVVQNKAVIPPNQRGAFGGTMPIVVRGEYTYPPFLWPGSVVDRLYDLGEELADQFDWPDEEAAAWFVLTGEAPESRPLDARWDTKGGGLYLNPQWRVRLTVPPWLPADEVEKAYRRMQRRILPGKNRGPDPKTLEVARFVWEQERLNGYRRPPWEALLQKWNEEHPGARFRTYNNFRTYAMRGVEAVVRLNFGWPDEEGAD
jgi:hypothetical protein